MFSSKDLHALEEEWKACDPTKYCGNNPKLIERRSGTVWEYCEGKIRCGVCHDKGVLCRGCSQLEYKYPGTFGCCSTSLICPNCFCLQGPDKKQLDEWCYNRFYFDSNFDNTRTNVDIPEEMFPTYVPTVIRFHPINIQAVVRGMWEQEYQEQLVRDIPLYSERVIDSEDCFDDLDEGMRKDDEESNSTVWKNMTHRQRKLRLDRELDEYNRNN